MSDLTVAKTILEQLGGNRFRVMTGAKDFVGSENSLQFRLPRAKDGINKIRITLDPSDTYTVEAFMLRGVRCFDKARHTDIYCEQLRSCFESMTGLRTSL